MELSAARALIADAVDRAVTPAAAIEVGRADAPIWQEAFGRLSYDAGAPPASLDTIFDLASLTKVMATTALVMREVARARLDIDAPVGVWLDGWDDGDHAAIRLRHLLDHSSGLPARARLWESIRGRAAFEAAIRDLPIEHPPGAASVYSDMGFITLGFVLEAAVGVPLDRQFDDLRREWNGSTTFNPSEKLRPRIAPTELDAEQGSVVHGYVHDENARALGGVAGHAGLFGAVTDVGAFARLVLRTFHEPTALGTPSVMRTFAAQCDVPSSSRALGWDTMRPTSSCGVLMSPDAIGHTGFTGTSLWIDHARDLYVAFLTNRIHPTRANDAHIALRPRVHDAIIAAFDAAS